MLLKLCQFRTEVRLAPDFNDQDIPLIVVANGSELLIRANSASRKKNHRSARPGQGGVVHRLEMADRLVGTASKFDDQGVALVVARHGVELVLRAELSR
jgi:hypothetical protein